MMTRIVPIALLSVLAIAGLSPARTVDVSIVDFSFGPETVSVAAGDTLRWTNHGAFSHTSTSGRPDSAAGALWDSPFLAAGDSFLLPVAFAAGDIPYYCRLHSLTMRGTVRVASGIEEVESSHPALTMRFTMRSTNPAAIAFDLPARQAVTLRLYDAAGREAALLLDRQELGPGSYRVPAVQIDLPDGLYIATLKGKAGEAAARLTIVH